jgi:hypothetical protein
MAAVGYLAGAIALMFSPDALVLLVALLAVPLAIALTVFIAGNRIVVMSISAIAGLIYASLGVWNWFRVEDFERANPGSVDDSGGLAALTPEDELVAAADKVAGMRPTVLRRLLRLAARPGVARLLDRL